MNDLKNVFMQLDQDLRKNKCPKCGNSTGGAVMRLEKRTKGMVTGRIYKKGEVLGQADAGLCICRSEYKPLK